MAISQVIVNALVTGSIYALIASGFSLIYATNRFMHFAHGATIVLAAYLFHFLLNETSLWVGWSFIITLTAGIGLGYLMQKLVYQQLEKKKSSRVILLIAAVSMLILVENLIQIFFGSSVRVNSIDSGLFTINSLGVSFTAIQAGIFVVTMLVFGLLVLVMNKSRLGLLFRAVSNNKTLSTIHGINAQKISTYAMLFGSFLGALSGIMLSLEQALFPGMGTKLMIKGFTAAIIGSIYYIPGSIVGGYIFGLLENIFAWYLPGGIKEALSFGILFLFLLFRPQGIFSKFAGERV